MLDLIGSAGWVVRDLNIECDNDETQNPSFGMMIGRNVASQICERFNFHNVPIDGWFDTGTYTPTLIGVANVAASTSALLRYKVAGNQVNVWGRLSVDPTVASVATQLGISLPVASAMTLGTELHGLVATDPAIPALCSPT